jgi:hypothetical protein
MSLLNRLAALERRTPPVKASANDVIAAQIAARLDAIAARRRAAGWTADEAVGRDAVAAALDAEVADAMERRRMIG